MDPDKRMRNNNSVGLKLRSSSPTDTHLPAEHFGHSRITNPLVNQRQTQYLIWFVLLHMPLGVLFFRIPALAVAWGYAVIGVGVLAVFFEDKDSPIPLYILAYLVGGEMMWRLLFVAPMIPHEVGKYAMLLITFIGAIRRHEDFRAWPVIPFLFLLCLLPSMILWVGSGEDLLFAREALIGTLGAPIALAMGAIYLTGYQLDRSVLTKLALIAIAPVVSVAAIATYHTWISQTSGELRFGLSSNDTASGGRGPNQVSNILAFGALFTWLVLVSLHVSSFVRLVLIGILIWFVGQMLLTFSRGGAITLAVSMAASALATTEIVKGRISIPTRNIIWAGVLLALFTLFVWPWVNNFTSGALLKRYDAGTTSASGRTEIAMGEIEIWIDHPVLGIGIGKVRETIGEYTNHGGYSHTEFTRLLAEHGIFGLVADLLFSIGLWHNFTRAKDSSSRFWIAGLGIYTIMYMSQVATRTVAPAFTYALTWTVLFSTKSKE